MTKMVNGVVDVSLYNNEQDFADVYVFIHEDGADWRFDVTADKTVNPIRIYDGAVQYSRGENECFEETQLVPSDFVKTQFAQARLKAVDILCAVDVLDNLNKQLKGYNDVRATVSTLTRGDLVFYEVDVVDAKMNGRGVLAAAWVDSQEQGLVVCDLVNDEANKARQVKTKQLTIELANLMELRDEGVEVIEASLQRISPAARAGGPCAKGMEAAYIHALEMMVSSQSVQLMSRTDVDKTLDASGVMTIYEAMNKVLVNGVAEAPFPMVGVEAQEYVDGLWYGYREALNELLTVTSVATTLSAKALEEAYPVDLRTTHLPKQVANQIQAKSADEVKELSLAACIDAGNIMGLHEAGKHLVVRDLLGKCDSVARGLLLNDASSLVRSSAKDALEKIQLKEQYAAKYQLTDSDKHFIKQFSNNFGTVQESQITDFIFRYQADLGGDASKVESSEDNHILDVYLLWQNAIGYAQQLQIAKANEQSPQAGYVFAFPGGSEAEAEELLNTLRFGGNDVEHIVGASAQACLQEVVALREKKAHDEMNLNNTL